jgi:hypothetical protein
MYLQMTIHNINPQVKQIKSWKHLDSNASTQQKLLEFTKAASNVKKDRTLNYKITLNTLF